MKCFYFIQISDEFMHTTFTKTLFTLLEMVLKITVFTLFDFLVLKLTRLQRSAV